MNKQDVLQLIVDKLSIDLDIAERAAQTAYETATHEENIAENKYDTLGLEASYLAAGQARRVEEIRQSLTLYRKWSLKPFDESRGIQTGDLVVVEDADGQTHYLFLGPDAAGLKVSAGDQLVTVITARAPLGQSLLGKFEDDAVQIVINGSRQSYEITQTL
ncbi:transcription elongation factor GreAB [Pseudomonas syringae]|uniref:GreA/GreB family elongation factor n=1 Tax=Pseudomonas syringae TaxID=317 RepID=UPI0008E4DAB8|nr:transcription elongation factor GreAB [Pseudomonas syringae]MBS7424789.1 transcription elongation factor GreAB [Pseudomonas syringae]MBS7430794.1 transcription elongation factor GreAB [Pseudomonas syringae]MCF5735225.1 transcription elongation factor GreAB [Pseudomonas syringae]MCF5740551.1 transcription elongation factor GreAB [Pseudomonas syringae]MCF5750104.1 transcription elongation factor GreAB [Pseudomonas syringae]